MQPEHTPGPWHIINHASPALVSMPRIDFTIAETNGNAYVAALSGIEARANAKLISAAPELYELVQAALYALNQIPNKSLQSGDYRTTYDIASAASNLLRKIQTP